LTGLTAGIFHGVTGGGIGNLRKGKLGKAVKEGLRDIFI
jgi:hypothetical protein